MKYRQLGSTGIKVSEIGFGAWQLGNARDWSGMMDSEAINLVHEALDQGCNFFDTAPNYGAGNSERLLGQALVGRRDQAVINSKFGHHPDNKVNFDPKLLRSSIESSLMRLKTDYIDSVLLHNPPFECLEGKTAHFVELEKLKTEGKIRAYGASVDSASEVSELIKSTSSEIVEVMFNINHQEPRSAFQTVFDKNIGLIIKVPLDSGWLSGKYDENSKFTDIRSRWSEEQLKRRSKLLATMKEILDPRELLVEAALRFILHYREVSTIIPGTKSIEQLKLNLSAAEKRMSEDIVKKLEKMWQDELQTFPLGW
ncbi:MAG: aldo/keto reductase [Neobacillus sp.]